MGRNRQSRKYLPRLRALRSPPGPPATLANLQREPKWIWLYCRACSHAASAAVAPLIILWGPDASPGVVRRCARCTVCGSRGATLIRQSWADITIGWQPFPADRLAEAGLQARGV
jgi:hypothetical protein